MDKGLIIKEICEQLVKKDKPASIDLAKNKYPFINYPTSKRVYTPYQICRVLLKDGFIDRYSGTKLLFPGIFRILKIELPEVFPAHANWKMSETHIVYWELFPTIDHINPIARGGEDNEENWITTSMIKNSAKANWTLEEIGWRIHDPGNLNDWDGLIYLFLELININPQLEKDRYIKKWKTSLLKAMKENNLV